MSPEQWESTHTAGPPCDLYALGCTLFFLLIGRAPFGDERHSTMVQKMKGHALEEPPRLRSLRPEVPEELDELCAQLLAKQPQDRIGSAKALATQLQSLLKKLAADKRQAGRHPLDRPGDGAVWEGSVSGPTPTARRTRRQDRQRLPVAIAFSSSLAACRGPPWAWLIGGALPSWRCSWAEYGIPAFCFPISRTLSQTIRRRFFPPR
jgi:serine/threonine protein kinase